MIRTVKNDKTCGFYSRVLELFDLIIRGEVDVDRPDIVY